MHLGLRNQLSTAKYYSIEDAKALVSPASPVVVIENDGVARAHPDAQMMRPHLAGNAEGLKGGNVVMTYCAVANLGLGYAPEIEGRKLDLEVMAQHGNSLILRDSGTREPIQHIFFGNSDRGQLPRVESLKAGLFWYVWVEFPPHTDVNPPAQVSGAAA